MASEREEGMARILGHGVEGESRVSSTNLIRQLPFVCVSGEGAFRVAKWESLRSVNLHEAPTGRIHLEGMHEGKAVRGMVDKTD